MKWSGKVIGGTVGLLVGLGPWGAALGALIGHQFDVGGGAADFFGRPFGGAPNPALVNQIFFPTTFRIMGHLAKADGRVSEQEIASARAIMHALRLNEAQIHSAIEYFTAGKQPDFDAEAALRRLRAAIMPYPDLAYFFTEIQLQAALAGNGLPAPVRARLGRVASLLGVGATDFARMESLLRFRMGAAAGGAGSYGARGGNGAFGGVASEEQLAQAYSVLAADAAMTDDQVTKAYRRQMSRHHPDKLMANGLPESMIERAKERAQQIQAAYELIRERRGIR
jgi:DnaJ like chaperone protein